MRTTKFLIAAALAAGAVATLPVQAHDMGAHGSCHAPAMGYGGMGRMMHRLGLSPDQRQALDAIDDKYRPQLRGLMEQLADNGRALRKLPADDAGLRTLADTEGKAVADMIVLRKQMRAEIDKVLTDEQRERLHRLMEHRRHPPGERWPGHDDGAWGRG
jgi:periplasmic protein CpxP/Spy